MKEKDGPGLFDGDRDEINRSIERDLQRELSRIPGATEVRYNGSDYDPPNDDERLTGQILRVYDAMKDGRWRSLSEIELLTGDPQASISAQLRHLRKERFGGHTVEKRPRGEREHGLFEYSLRVNFGEGR